VVVPHNHLIADTILQNFSWKSLAARAYASGQFPLWNPYILAGQPFLAAGQNGSLYPPGVLYYLLPNGQAYAWFIALHLALGGALTYWFLKVLGASRFGGLVAGITFSFCGYLIVSVLWPMVVSTAIWLPGVLAVVELLIRCCGTNGTRLAGGDAGNRGLALPAVTVPLVLAGAGMVAMQFLAGHLEMSLHLMSTAGLYAAIRLLGVLSSAGAEDRRPMLSGVVLFTMIALGSLGAGVQLVPFFEAISANVRGGQVTFDEVRSYALPREQIAAFVAPDFFGNPSHHAVFDLFAGAQRAVDRPLEHGVEQRLGTEWGPKNYVEGTAYLGVLPLLLATVTLLVRRDGSTWALAAIAGLSLLLAFGTPLYGLLFYGLPGINQLHTPFRWVYAYSLSLAVLAGLGATAIADGLSRSARLERLAWFSVLLGGAGVLGLMLAWLGRDVLLVLAERALRFSRTLAEALPDAQALYSYQWAHLLGPALLLLASGLVLLALARRAPGAKALALGLLVGDLFSFGIGFNTITDPAPLSFVPPEIRAIQADSSHFRIATLGEDDTLPANTNMLFGLQDIRGYDTIILRDYVGYLELIEPQRGLLYSKVSKLFESKALDSPLLDLLNVKYVLTTLPVDRPGWRLLDQDSESSRSGSQATRGASERGLSEANGGAVQVYENQRVLPRAFLVTEALGAEDAAEALRLLARPEFDPRSQVVLEGSTLPPGPAMLRPDSREAANLPWTAISMYEPNRVAVEVIASGPSYLVLSDMFFQGWSARVDGIEQPLLRANRIFRAVQVEQGRHLVTFEYRPISFRLGALLSLLACALAVLALGGWSFARLGLLNGNRLGPVGRVAKNSLFPLATGLLNRVFDFAFALVYLRVLGPQGTGAYTFAVVVVGYFDILVNFGLGTLLTRDVARDPSQAERYFGNTLATRLGLAALVLLAALALAGPLSGPLQIGPEVGLAIVLLTIGMLPSALASTAGAMFMARERMEVPAAVTVLSTLVKIGLGTAVLLAGWGIVGLAAVSLAVNLLNALVLGALLAAMLGRPRLQLDLRFSGGLLALSWPLMLNNFLNSLFFRIDAVLLKPLAGEVALGHYATAYKFIDGLQIIPSTFVQALFPVLSRQAAGQPHELVRAFGLGLKVLLVLALPISVGTTLLAEPIVGLLAGPAFLPDSALALQVLIWFLPFSFVNGLTQYVLIALNRQRWITLSFFVAAAANLALNLWAIPRYGFLGAAVTTVVSEWVLLAPFWYAVRQHVGPVPLLNLTWRPTLAALIMGLVVYWARDLNPWLAIPLGAVVYAVALLALGTLRKDELQALRQARVPGTE
jgi:O-antigen/teichoic acid export membrane protein